MWWKVIAKIIPVYSAAHVLDYFQSIVKDEPGTSAAVASIRTLMWILENLGDGWLFNVVPLKALVTTFSLSVSH